MCGEHSVRASVEDNTGQNRGKAHTHTHTHTPNPRTEIKIPDPAGNRTRAAGLEVRDSTDHTMATDKLNPRNINYVVTIFNINIFGIRLQIRGRRFFFNWLFIVALTARSYRDCHWFSVLGMVLY